MKIDVHSHHIPQRFIEPGDNADAPFRVRVDTSQYLSIPPVGFESEQLYSIDRRIQDMQSQGVDMHVLSTPPLLFLYRLDADKGLDICRRVNDSFAEIVSSHPDRFVAIADLPMQSPEDAARELERAVRDLGLRGAEICSNVNGTNLNDKSFAPVWAKMQELDVPFFIHPSNVLGQDRLADYYLSNLIGNPTDTAVAAASLIFGGVLKEFPRLKFYLAHGGGSCPFILGRWDHGWRVRPEGKVRIEKPPSEYFRLLYFDSLTHSVPALNYLIDIAGPERVMMGTDYPFDMGDYESVKTVGSLPHQSDAQKELIYGDNAMRLFKIGR